MMHSPFLRVGAHSTAQWFIRSAPMLMIAGSGLAALGASVAPELAAERAAFEQQLAERVTNPKTQALNQLNQNYRRALDAQIEREKLAGRLDAVIALEAERKRLDSPESEAEELPELPQSAANLRAIRTQELEKIEASSQGALGQILPPFLRRLDELEVSLTRADRVPDALQVREYRLSLAQAPTDEGSPPPPTGEIPSEFSDVNEIVAAIPREVLRRMRSNSSRAEAMEEANRFLTENIRTRSMRVEARPMRVLEVVGTANKFRVELPRDLLGRNDGDIRATAFWCYFRDESPSEPSMVATNRDHAFEGRIGRCELTLSGAGIVLNIDLQETVLDPEEE